MMLEGLDAVDWRKLKHARGAAANVPQLLLALAGSERRPVILKAQNPRRYVDERGESGLAERLGACDLVDRWKVRGHVAPHMFASPHENRHSKM
jgi:hypothetical protein